GLILFSDTGFRRVGTDFKACYHIPGCKPRGVVHRVSSHTITGNPHAVVFGGIDGLIRFSPAATDLTITVRVEYCRTPTLRLLGALGLVIYPGVDPARDIEITSRIAEIESVIRIRSEPVMMRCKTRVNLVKTLGLGIEQHDVFGRSSFKREVLCEFVCGSILTKTGLV